MVHSIECIREQAAIEAFDKRYPNHCRACDGAGSRYAAGTRDTPPEDDACVACIDNGKCPLCASPVSLVEHDKCDYSLCSACGWDEWKIINGEVPPIIRPDGYCECELDAAEVV